MSDEQEQVQQSPAPQSPPHVLTAIRGVSADLAKMGIAKEGKNKEQGFTFRGIDQVMNALAPLLVKHSLSIFPHFANRQVEVRKTAKGNLIYDVCLDAAFDFVSTVDGTKVTAHTIGEGMDSGDKATNKAMAIAYKYAMFQTFCIPLEPSDDPDMTTPEATVADRPARNSNEQLLETADHIEEVLLTFQEAGDLKELATLFTAGQQKLKDLAKANEWERDWLIDSLGSITKAKDIRKAALQKAAEKSGGAE